jgi:hypothetical protein
MGNKRVNFSKEKSFVLSDKFAITLLIGLPIIYFLIFAPGLLTGAKMMYGSDWLLGGYAAREKITREIAQFKTIPMWYNYIFSGLPTITGPYGDAASVYPFIRLIIPTHLFWTYLFILGFIIAGIGMYLFLKSIGISNSPAFLGSIAYMFAGNLATTTYAGHEGRLLAAAFFPLAFFFWHQAISTKKFFWFVCAGALVGISFTHAHFQLTYYGLWVAFAYFIMQLILNRKLNGYRNTIKLILYTAVSVIIALGILSVSYLPLLTNLKYTARGEVRGFEFASSWSLPAQELLDLIVPQFSGILDNYWGENMFKLHSEYFGIVFLLLGLLMLLIKFRDRRVIFFLISGVVATLIALGAQTPFFKLIYYTLPGIKRFRGPSMVFYIVAFSVIVLGAIALQFLFEHFHDKKGGKDLLKKIKKFAYIITIGFLILIFLFILGKNNIISSIQEPRKVSAFNENLSSLWNGVLITSVLIIVILILICSLCCQKIKSNTFLIVLTLLILFDLWRVDKMFLRTVDPPNVYYGADEVINYLKKDSSLFRVHPLYYERASDGLLDLYNIHNAGGYAPSPLQTYQDFLGAEKTVLYSAPNLRHSNFLNLLNIKYIISVPLPEDISKYDLQTQALINDLKSFTTKAGIELVYIGRKNLIYRNNQVLPRAFIVPDYEVIQDKDQILKRLKDPNFDPARVVIVSESISNIDRNVSSDNFHGSVKILQYSPNKIVLEAELNRDGFLVLSENYHPDWFCKVDYQPAVIYRAYHTLRAVYLKSGKHTIEFYYNSKYYNIGRVITIITYLLCAATICIEIIRARQRKLSM